MKSDFSCWNPYQKNTVFFRNSTRCQISLFLIFWPSIPMFPPWKKTVSIPIRSKFSENSMDEFNMFSIFMDIFVPHSSEIGCFISILPPFVRLEWPSFIIFPTSNLITMFLTDFYGVIAMFHPYECHLFHSFRCFNPNVSQVFPSKTPKNSHILFRCPKIFRSIFSFFCPVLQQFPSFSHFSHDFP